MAIPIKDVSVLQAKYSSRAQAAAPDYTAGVTNTTKSWASNTAAAAQTWATGVQGAVANGMFQKGVSKAGDSKWQNGAKTKGAQRYGQGVAQGASNWGTNVAPYLQVIAGLTLPPRGPKRSPANLARVQAVVQALEAKKTGG